MGERSDYSVVVGVDGSSASQEALRWAVGEARARHGHVTAIHAWESPYDFQLEVFFPPGEEALRGAAQQRLDGALAGFDAGDVLVVPELIQGDARRVLVSAGDQADLLVVGSHGRGRVTEVVLGSVSTYCTHHAGCPVVVVRSGAGIQPARR